MKTMIPTCTPPVETPLLAAPPPSRKSSATAAIAPRRWLRLLLVCVPPLAGCSLQGSYPMREDHLVRLDSSWISDADGGRLATRDWAKEVHPPMEETLPPDKRAALFPETLCDQPGHTRDVFGHFGLQQELLDTIYGNFGGVLVTGRMAGPRPGTAPSPPWQGFRDVKVRLRDGAKLHLRLGTPEPEDEIPGSYVVITHGLFGSLEGVGMINHVQALRLMGHHVLAIEMRGHGQRNEASAKLPMTFGVRETSDLLTVAHWLKTKHDARRVGLVAFSVSGFEALLAAWLDAVQLSPADAARPILRHVPASSAEPAFNGGIFIISPPVGIHTVSRVLGKNWNLVEAPVRATFQQRVKARMREFDAPPPRDLWDFIMAELRRDDWVKVYGSETALRADMEWFIDLQR
ncbi:MAG: hypothetical protein MUF04_03975, partial [Akkermansiaceae bacterium]|nr:hypothetical protein [Akkermansiaceae bacterium]